VFGAEGTTAGVMPAIPPSAGGAGTGRTSQGSEGRLGPAFVLLAAAIVLACPGTAHADAGFVRPTFDQVSNMFAPTSLPAEKIRDLAYLVIGICGGIFLAVAGLLTYTIVRFRERPEDHLREPPQVYGSNNVEAAWTIVPVVIVIVLFLATARTINELEIDTPPEDALQVTAVGHQWWWEFRYPQLGVVTANELHIPVSTADRPQPTFLKLLSQDVVHSFWVPRLAGKVDVVPNRANEMWIDTATPGLYLGQCAEYCGTQHAHMLLRVYVHPEDEFQRWVEHQKSPDVVDATVAAGRAVFEQTACINCHTLGGTVGDGTFGPSLSHLMSRETIGAGVATNTEANLRAWIVDPQVLKPGARMPAMKLDDAEIDQLVAYLVTLE
jgi:cytochrome c oxidase subunit II